MEMHYRGITPEQATQPVSSNYNYGKSKKNKFMAKELSKEMIEDRLLYCNAMRMITKKEATVILLHEYNSILKSLELLTESIGEDEKKYSLLKRLFLIEDQIISKRQIFLRIY